MWRSESDRWICRLSRSSTAEREKNVLTSMSCTVSVYRADWCLCLRCRCNDFRCWQLSAVAVVDERNWASSYRTRPRSPTASLTTSSTLFRSRKSTAAGPQSLHVCHRVTWSQQTDEAQKSRHLSVTRCNTHSSFYLDLSFMCVAFRDFIP